MGLSAAGARLGCFTSRVYARYLAPPHDLLAEALSGGLYMMLRLAEALEVPPHGRILDVGTGTGALPILLRGARPDATVVGVDVDLGALQRARRSAARSGTLSAFTAGRAERLPFPAQHFDAVISALTLHHLPSDVKLAACREFARVLRPGGTCYVADFAPPRSAWARWAGIIPRLTCFRHIGDNFRGRIPRLLLEAGFGDVEEVFQTAWSVSLHRARRSRRTGPAPSPTILP